MPNWVFNTLTIEGNPWDMGRVETQLNQPFTTAIEVHNMGDINAHGYPTKIKQVNYSNPVFAFHNIINYTEHGITDEEYACQPARSELPLSDPNWWQDNLKIAKTDKSWYSWNNTNWGTKWDVAVADGEEYPETELIEKGMNGENLVLVYRFNTAWGIPDEALKTLSSQYPALLFTLSYEEETGWGGECEYLRGENLGGSEYNWCCRECGYEELGEPPYCEDCDFDMCPKCGYGEPNDEDRAQCPTHSVELANN